jgi:hypothetical protein
MAIILGYESNCINNKEGEMSQLIIKSCDICGYKIKSSEKKHWSDCICEVEISLKSHSGCQEIPYSGEICTECARSISNAVRKEVDKLDALKNLKKNN